MAEIINLRQARKARARTERENQAERNRQKHGEAKSAKSLRKRKAEKISAGLTAHRRDKPHTEPPKS
ncbi:MAG: DUF4169 family protein [Pseudomonadota bacterium]